MPYKRYVRSLCTHQRERNSGRVRVDFELDVRYPPVEVGDNGEVIVLGSALQEDVSL